jgi:hypothetical protein
MPAKGITPATANGAASARHAAYGLDIHARFPLPGMPLSRGTGLPTLTLELVAPVVLQQLWSGPIGGPTWTGRLGDGRTLAIERGAGGDVLFTYEGRARFRLDASQERLECAPLRPGLHWQQVLLARILPNVALVRGYEALHASAVKMPDGGVVAVAGPSGAGKTTLALELLSRGWALFTDDVLVLGEGPDGVQAHPGAPHMNVADDLGGAIDQRLGTVVGRLTDEHWISARAVAHGPSPVRMVCLLERGTDGQRESQALPSNLMPLIPYMIGLAGDAERERSRFARYADLMADTSLMRLVRGDADRPAVLADRVERALPDWPMLAVGGTW